MIVWSNFARVSRSPFSEGPRRSHQAKGPCHPAARICPAQFACWVPMHSMHTNLLCANCDFPSDPCRQPFVCGPVLPQSSHVTIAPG